LLGSDAEREMLKPKRGPPALARPKEHVNIRLDADVVGVFKDSGAGGQTRINNVLRECQAQKNACNPFGTVDVLGRR